MIFVFAAGFIFIIESLIKSYIDRNKKFGEEKKILNGEIIIEKYHNDGTAFQFFKTGRKLLLIITGGFFAALLCLFGKALAKENNAVLKTGMSLLTAGAASNTAERFFKGYVVDYFSFRRLRRIIFNLSDCFIFIGGILSIIASFFTKRQGV